MGNKADLKYIVINRQKIYSPNLRSFFVDAQAGIYKKDSTPYSYKYARLSVKANIYENRSQIPMTANVHSPSGKTYRIYLENRVMFIQDLLPASELEWIKSTAKDGQTFVYLAALENLDQAFLQFVPVYFTYQTKIVSDED